GGGFPDQAVPCDTVEQCTPSGHRRGEPMDTKSMTRKEFVTLTFTLIGSAAAACSSSSSSNDGGTGGSFGSGGSNGTGGTTGTGGHGGRGGGACASPLPETQVPDTTGHTHTVTIPAVELDATT